MKKKSRRVSFGNFILVVRALPPANIKLGNTCVSMKILDQEQKTKVIKTKEKGKPSTGA